MVAGIGIALSIIIGAILLIILGALPGGDIVAGGVTMMAGLISHPLGWNVRRILTALIAPIGYLLSFQSDQQTGGRLPTIRRSST